MADENVRCYTAAYPCGQVHSVTVALPEMAADWAPCSASGCVLAAAGAV